jgi:hypothetical protein
LANSELGAGRNRAHRTNVRNGTVWESSRCHDRCMPQKKSKIVLGTTTVDSIKTEIAKPRMSRSARMMERNLDAAQIPKWASTTVSGTVGKIVSSSALGHPEKAQIALEGTARRYRNLRIKNALIDRHGDCVKLKKGPRVEVTITAKPKASATICPDVTVNLRLGQLAIS